METTTAPEVKWPPTPAALQRTDGVQWHVTRVKRENGTVLLKCNDTPFCVLRPGKGSDRWIVPTVGPVNDLLRAMQAASQAYLGTESKWVTLWSC